MNVMEMSDMMADQRRTLTVGELLEKLAKMPKKANVYLLTDKDVDTNWDEENECWRRVLPVKHVSLEERECFDGWCSQPETNVLLEAED